MHLRLSFFTITTDQTRGNTMSCYESERGGYSFTITNYRNLRKQMIIAQNDLQERIFLCATDLYNDIVKNKSNKKAKQKNHHLYGEFKLPDLAKSFGIKRASGTNIKYAILDEIFRGASGKKTPLKPRKSAWPKIPLSKQDFSLEITSEAEMVFASKDRHISWEVRENNRSCEAAWETNLGEKFESLLAKHKWARGEGGQILHQDEYGRDEFACPNETKVYGTHAVRLEKKWKSMR